MPINFSHALNPVFRFLLKVLILYIAWFVLYEQWLHPDGRLDNWVIQNSLSLSSIILRLFNYNVAIAGRGISVDEKTGLSIGDACDGVNLIALFIGFIIAFPGSIKNKIIFCIGGSIAIHLLNVLRIASLSVIQLYHPDWMEFHHAYTFTFTIYAFIFGMWMLWVNKFSKIRKSDTN